MSINCQVSVEQGPKLVWPYVRRLKEYRCLDCCVLIEFEERQSYFATGFCAVCEPCHPKTRWPRQRRESA